MRKLAFMAVLCAGIVTAGCNTVRGAAADMNSAANCTEEAIKTGTGRC